MFFLLLLILFSVDELHTLDTEESVYLGNMSNAEKFGALILENIPQKDTIFVLGDSFVEIRLDSQVAHLYRRDGSFHEYKISTGTDKISKGILTREGLFSVQNKTPIARSSQFNNAELLNWIGYNYNIGFHGLRSSSYYRYLGKRPSSHGCIRISREDVKELYDQVQVGTPVIVFDEEPARVLKFANESDIIPNRDFILKQRGYDQLYLLRDRLQNLYKGDSYLNSYARVFIDGKTALRPGSYDIGKAYKIMLKQKYCYIFKVKTIIRKDNLFNNQSKFYSYSLFDL